jgi:hypothetical protein
LADIAASTKNTCGNPGPDGWIKGKETTITTGGTYTGTYYVSIKHGITCDGDSICKVADNQVQDLNKKDGTKICNTHCTDCCENISGLNACLTDCPNKDYIKGVSDEIIAAAAENKSLCDTYASLKKSSGLIYSLLGDLADLASKISSSKSIPGCSDYCTNDSQGNPYSSADQVSCLCTHTGTNGVACMDPTSTECKNAGKVTCEDQVKALNGNCGGDCASLKAACDCGKRNEVDPRGGWYQNDQGTCVNTNNNNNNNNDNAPTIQYGPDGSKLPDAAANNNNTGSPAAKDNAAGMSSKLSLGGGAGSPAKGSTGVKIDQGKADLSAQTGHGAGRASLALAGTGNAAGGGGGGQDFKAKKGEKPKDIAKSDEDIFKLVSTIYKDMVQANALDSIRPMKKLEKKPEKKPATKQKAKKA